MILGLQVPYTFFGIEIFFNFWDTAIVYRVCFLDGNTVIWVDSFLYIQKMQTSYKKLEIALSNF